MTIEVKNIILRDETPFELDSGVILKDNYAYFNPNKVKTEIEPFPYVYDIFKEKVTKGEKLYMLDSERNHKKKNK